MSIIIPTHNRKEKVIRLINSVLASEYPMEKMEIIVVDDASTDGTYEYIQKKFPLSNVLDKPNIVWSAGIIESLWTTLGKFIGQNETKEKEGYKVLCRKICGRMQKHRIRKFEWGLYFLNR